MSIECPSCRHVLKLKGVKAGRYTPRCPRCGQQFGLLVSGADDTLHFTVRALPVTAATVVGAGADSVDFEVAAHAIGPESLPFNPGGYEFLKPLGRGGMGVVYLARQVSLDRLVALKVMNAHWASDPTFLARFTREAFAAAQLVHHNIVQIYDVGTQDNVPYFSMEYVKGHTLSELVKEHGKLDVEEAVGYVLQAARGLAYAHSRGMVHRDVKPDNLMLNELGLIKVADLGLVKTPGEVESAPVAVAVPDLPPSEILGSLPSITRAGLTLGTPNFMAPEQGRDPSGVDARADIYSLGCTLYFLVTGRAPFRGDTAMEVLVKHLSEAPVPPEQINALVPGDVSALVLKMMAKKPADRAGSMEAVLRELEQVLGARRAGNLGPTQAQADTLESCARRFNEVPAARLRSRVHLGFFAAALGLTVLGGLIGFRPAAGVVVLAATTLLFSFLVGGYSGRTHLFLKARDWLRVDWPIGGTCLLLLAGFLVVLGLLKFWPGFSAVAAALAATYHFTVRRPLAAQRAGIVEEARGLLKELRQRGLAEESVHQFVCVHGGLHWEEFFEELFGYDALVQARTHWGRADGRPRPTHAAWRDPLVRWMAARQQARQEARERRQSRQVRAENVEASPVQPSQTAEVRVEQAAAPGEPALPVPQPEAPVAIPVRSPGVVPEQPAVRRRASVTVKVVSGMLSIFAGPKVRFLAGAALLVTWFLWMVQNELVPGEEGDLSGFAAKLDRAEPLSLWAGRPLPLLNGFNPAGAGLLLLLSALTRSGRLVFFLVLGAGVTLAGHLCGLPAIGPVKAPYVGLVAGCALAEFGVVFDSASRGY